MSGSDVGNSLVPLSGQKSVLRLRCLNETIGRPVDASLFHREILDQYKDENPPECPGASLVFEEALSNKSFPLLLRLGAAWTTNKYVKVPIFSETLSQSMFSHPRHHKSWTLQGQSVLILKSLQDYVFCISMNIYCWYCWYSEIIEAYMVMYLVYACWLGHSLEKGNMILNCVPYFVLLW